MWPSRDGDVGVQAVNIWISMIELITNLDELKLLVFLKNSIPDENSNT
jgi:hypothetical protein